MTFMRPTIIRNIAFVFVCLFLAGCDHKKIVAGVPDFTYRGSNLEKYRSASDFKAYVVGTKTWWRQFGLSNPQIAIELAKRVDSRVKNVYLIEPDRERAEYASKQLSRTMVLCGDITETDFFEEYSLAKGCSLRATASHSLNKANN